MRLIFILLLLSGCQANTFDTKRAQYQQKINHQFYEALKDEEQEDIPDQMSLAYLNYEFCRSGDSFEACYTSIDYINTYIDELDHESALAYAWLGSAYALSAKTFPLPYLWYIVPGPGFYRIYEVGMAIHYLDKAYELDSKDPIVLLIYGKTMSQLPGIFMQHQKGLDALKLLDEMMLDAKANAFKEHNDTSSVVNSYKLAKIHELLDAEDYTKTKPYLTDLCLQNDDIHLKNYAQELFRFIFHKQCFEKIKV